MGKFYLETSEVGSTGQYMIFEMSATTDIAVSISNSLSQYPIEDGSLLTDHVIESPKTISLSGIITDVASLSINTGSEKQPFRTDTQVDAVRQYIEILEQKINDRETFSVYFSNILKPVKDCFITRFSFSKNNTLGGEAWLLQLELTRVRIAQRAQFVYKPDVNWRALLAQPKKAASNKASCDAAQTSNVSGQVENTNPESAPPTDEQRQYILWNWAVNGTPPPELQVTPAAVAKKSTTYKPNVPLTR